MIKRIVEFILGIVVVLLILGKYGDEQHPLKPLIAYVTGNVILQLVIYILLIISGFRLIGGKSKDYSKFFYKLLMRLFGNSSKDKS